MSGPIMTLREIMDAEDDFNLDITEDMEREFSPQRKDTSMAFANENPEEMYAKMAVDAAYRGQKSSALLGAIGSQQQAYATVSKQSPMDMLSMAVARLGEVRLGVSELATQFCGYPPEMTSAPKGYNESPDREGFFQSIEKAARDIDAYSTSVAEDLKRIRARL